MNLQDLSPIIKANILKSVSYIYNLNVSNPTLEDVRNFFLNNPETFFLNTDEEIWDKIFKDYQLRVYDARRRKSDLYDRYNRKFRLQIKIKIYQKKDENGVYYEKLNRPFRYEIKLTKTLVNIYKNEIEKIANEKLKTAVDGVYETAVIESITPIYKWENENFKGVAETKTPMNDIVLKMGWLKYAESIAPSAFVDFKGECVVNQLCEYLINPPSGRPTKFINGARTSVETLKNYFNNSVEKSFNNSVNIEQVIELGKDIKRSVYAFNQDDKIIKFNLSSDKKGNYAPIVFYCSQGHMYLINNKKIFKSVSKKANGNGFKTEKDFKKKKEVWYNNKEMIYTNHKCSYKIMEIIKMKNESMVLCVKDPNAIIMKELFYHLLDHYALLSKVKMCGDMIISLDFVLNGEKIKIIKSNDYGKMTTKAVENFCKSININDYVGQGVLKIVNHILTDGDKKANPLNKIKSNYDLKVLRQIVSNDDFKLRQFADKLVYDDDRKENEENGLITQKVDLSRCRKNLLYNNAYAIPIFTPNDIPEQYSYNGEILECGFYFIETENYFPFRGNGWYPHSLTQYGLECKIINHSNIIDKLIASKFLRNDYFKDIINKLYSVSSDNLNIQKLLVNAMIGGFGSTSKEQTEVDFNICPYEATNRITNLDYNNDTMISCENVKIGGKNRKLYITKNKKRINNNYNQIAVYNMVLGLEAEYLHRIETKLLQKGAIIYERQTDAIVYGLAKHYEVKIKYANGVRATKQEEKINYLHKCVGHTNTIQSINYGDYLCNFTKYYDLNACEIMKLNSCILKGQAGTGKSTIINEITQKYNEDGVKYRVLTPTNMSANLVNGGTIHKSMVKGLKDFEDIKTIIADEMSMYGSELLTYLYYVKVKYPNMRFILVGDFKQLKPVEDNTQFNKIPNYEYGNIIHKLSNGNEVILSKNHRANEELGQVYKDPYNLKINITERKPLNNTTLNLCYTNKQRKVVNLLLSKKYEMENESKKSIDIKEVKGNELTQDYTLLEGMPIISKVNSKKANIVNNEMFIVDEIDGNNIIIISKQNKKKHTIDKSYLRYNFLLAFCITIHASQGQTIKEPYTIYEWNKLDKYAKYVAVSRATKLDDIFIVN